MKSVDDGGRDLLPHVAGYRIRPKGEGPTTCRPGYRFFLSSAAPQSGSISLPAIGGRRAKPIPMHLRHRSCLDCTHDLFLLTGILCGRCGFVHTGIPDPVLLRISRRVHPRNLLINSADIMLNASEILPI